VLKYGVNNGGETMANIKSAIKRMKQNEKRRLRNVIMKSKIKTAIRRFNESLANNTIELKQKRLSEVTSLLDKAAQKGIIHKNKAARKKSRLALTLQKTQTKANEA
jgi:small subunit ribosomal protein S20